MSEYDQEFARQIREGIAHFQEKAAQAKAMKERAEAEEKARFLQKEYLDKLPPTPEEIEAKFGPDYL